MPERFAYILLAASLVFTTLAYGGVHQPIIAIYFIFVTLAGVLLAIGAVRSGEAVRNRELIQLPLIGAAVYAFLQVVPFGSIALAAGVEGIPRTISLDPYSTWVSAFQFTAATIFLSGMLICLNSAKRIRRLTFLLVIFGFGFAFFAILQSVLSPDKIYGIYEAAGGSFGSFVNRNNFASYVVMILGLPLGLLFVGSVPKDQWLLFLTAIALLGVALLLSDSRGGLVAFISEIILIVVLTRKKARSKKDMAVRAGLIVLLIAAIVGGSIFVGGDTSFTRIAETAASDDFTSSRSHIWRVTLSVIAANMPLGTGFGAFGVAYTSFDPSGGMFRVEQAHNDYFQVIADAGIPGLLLGSLFLFQFVRLGIRTTRIENEGRRGIAIGALAGCFAVLVHSIFDFVLHITAVSLLFLTLLAILCRSQYAYDDDISDEPNHKKGPRPRRGFSAEHRTAKLRA